MDDLVTWLRGVLDEREQRARKDLWCVERATNGGDWRIAFGRNLPYSMITADGDEIGRLTAMPDGPVPDGAELPHNADAMLVGRMVKAAKARAEQTLREVEATRRIIDETVPEVENMDSQIAEEWGVPTKEIVQHPEIGPMEVHHYPRGPEPGRLLRLLALPYADRPGFREEWHV